MAREIPGLKIGQFKNATHLEAMTDVEAKAKVCPGITQYAPQALAAFSQAVAKEVAANLESQKSQYTEQITKKDSERDSSLDLVKIMIRNIAMTGAGDAKEAAQFLMSMAKVMKVKASKQYDEETGAITIAVDELLGAYLNYTEAAGIKSQVEQLKRLNDEMCELIVLRDTERGEQGQSKVAEARAATDEAYRELIRQVNALNLVFSLGHLNGAPAVNPFAEFVSYMIGAIDRYKREIFRTSSTKPAGSEEVEEEVTEEETETDESENNGEGENNGDNSASDDPEYGFDEDLK